MTFPNASRFIARSGGDGRPDPGETASRPFRRHARIWTRSMFPDCNGT